MRNHKTTAVLLITAFALALIPGSTGAQRLYNKERDQQAQAALPLAQVLKTGELFDRQLRNLAALTKKDFDTHFAFTKSRIGTFSLNLLTWDNAHKRVCEIEERIGVNKPSAEAIAKELKTVKDSIAAAQESLKAFKKSINAIEEKEDGEDEEEKPVLATIFGSLGQLEEITKFADEVGAENSALVNAETIQTLKEVQKIAAELKKVYDEYTKKVDDFNKLNAQLAELRIVLKKVAIQSLQVDEEHWKNLAAITARREAETADVMGLISRYKGIVNRLALVKFFDEKAEPPKERKLFCEAINAPTEEPLELDIGPSQIITDHLWELAHKGQSIDTDTRAFETAAVNALVPMSSADSEEERRAKALPTLDALITAIRNINTKLTFSSHDAELKLQNNMLLAETNLRAATRISTPTTLNALRAVIILARQSRRETRGMVSDIPQALYILAALSGRGATPAVLAELRFAQELHAYSIRKSAVRARAYELTVSTGAQRLALFHKGGIKPSDVAQLVFTASNVAISPAILAR
jgi:hypothetical protein